jgi:hypothetical protein
MISYPVSSYRMRCRCEPPFSGSANPGHWLSKRGHEYSGNRAADWRSSRHDYAPWRSCRSGLRRAARPHDGRASGRAGGIGRIVGVRRQEATAFEAYGQPGQGRSIYVRRVGLVVPRDHRLPYWQATHGHNGPVYSGLARSPDWLARNFNRWLPSVTAGDPRCVPKQRARRHQQDVQRYAPSQYRTSATSLLAGRGHRGSERSSARCAGRNQHVLCGAQQSFDPHGVTALYSPHKWLQQDAEQSLRGGELVYRPFTIFAGFTKACGQLRLCS